MYFPIVIITNTSLPILFACLCLCRPMYVCLFAYNSEMGVALVSKFLWCPGMVLCTKFGERVMGRGQKVGIFRCSLDWPAMRRGRQTGHCDGHWTGYRRTQRRRQRKPVCLDLPHTVTTQLRLSSALSCIFNSYQVQWKKSIPCGSANSSEFCLEASSMASSKRQLKMRRWTMTLLTMML